MPLDQGTRLGPYEIIRPLGAGGMGEVYRARDVRLHRDVAIKLLTGSDRGAAAAGLLREARNASALSHPNICTLHEIDDSGERPFIVMELVEGEPLDRRIGSHALPAPTVIRLAMQIAEALVHAHARGIVHRDLKSANVVITEDGRAKVLDFGIAKRMTSADLAEATRSIATLTADHEIAGTLPYMAPEVLEGRPADARSDLWALGVMLVEMSSGMRPFAGATGLALSTAILRDEARIPDGVPPPLADVIRTLLAKEPARRYQSAAEVVAALQRLSAPQATGATGAPAPAARRITLPAVTAIGLVLAALAAAAWWYTPRRSTGSEAPGPIGSIAVLPLENLSSDRWDDGGPHL